LSACVLGFSAVSSPCFTIRMNNQVFFTVLFFLYTIHNPVSILQYSPAENQTKKLLFIFKLCINIWNDVTCNNFLSLHCVSGSTIRIESTSLPKSRCGKVFHCQKNKYRGYRHG
jgi:hypothetical protein